MIRGHILKICFRQLSAAMQSLRTGDKDTTKDLDGTNPAGGLGGFATGGTGGTGGVGEGDGDYLERSYGSVGGGVGSVGGVGGVGGTSSPGGNGSYPVGYWGDGSGGSSRDDFSGYNPSINLGETDMFPTYPNTPRKEKKIIGVQGSSSLDEWFDDGDIILDSKAIARAVARLILLLLLYIQRFDHQPTQLITLQILAGQNYFVNQ